MSKKILIALPPTMLESVDQVATNEHRTRSDLVREALRQYLERFKDRMARRIGRDDLGRPYIQGVESTDV